jgi:hypothetical protein
MSDEPENLGGNVRSMRQKGLRLAASQAPATRDADEQQEMTFLPANCPVQPIGMNQDEYYYLDMNCQLRKLKAGKHVRCELMALFGHKDDVLERFWPRKTQDKKTMEWSTTGWKPAECPRALMNACSRAGLWNAEERERGPGAWRTSSGELILHVGDGLLTVAPTAPVAGACPWIETRPSLVQGMVYPAAPASVRPHAGVQRGGPSSAGAELLTLLETWNWRRKGVDANLLLGWIGSAMICGALEWRAAVWITGSKSTGKTTLQKLVKDLMGERGLLESADATASSIRQTLGKCARAVAIDELESTEDNRKLNSMVNLARIASSGGQALRGSAEHQAVSFTLRSSFLFSSILVPSMEAQDKSRLAFLELDAIEASGMPRPSILSERKIGEIGQRLLRRMLDQWHRLGPTYVAYRDALAGVGHDSRRQDGFGTLLACADCLLFDDMPDGDRLIAWAKKLNAGALAEMEGDQRSETGCLDYLLTTKITSVHDRQEETIAEWLAQAHDEFMPGRTPEEWAKARNVNKMLATHGVKVVRHKTDGEIYLAVASVHRGVEKLFEKTKWQALPGAAGVWVQALRRLPGHVVPATPVWIGSLTRCTLVPKQYWLENPETRVKAPAPLLPDEEDYEPF